MFNSARDAIFLSSYKFNTPSSTSYYLRTESVLDYKLSGETMYHWGDGKKIRAVPGTVLFIPQNLSFSTEIVTPGQYVEVKYRSTTLPEPEIRVFSDFGSAEMEKLFLSAAEANYDRDGSGFFEAQVALNRIFSVLYRTTDRYINNKALAVLSPSLQYMKDNLFRQDFSVAEMEALSGVSDTYFRRLFTKYYGMSPKRYCIHERIQKAMTVMDGDPDLTLQAVANATGFGDSYYFCRIFKQETGMTPGEYEAKSKSTHPAVEFKTTEPIDI